MSTAHSTAVNKNDTANLAVDLIRQKLQQVYQEEPTASQELSEARSPGHHSRHQQFMLQLSQSGKSLAEIQTAWHNYYQSLTDSEKHKVWQEFYTEHNRRSSTPQIQQIVAPQPPEPAASSRKQAASRPGSQSVHAIKNNLLRNIRSQSKPGRSSHLKSLLFGLSMGTVVVAILLFGFFNERFLAPFVTPSKSASSTPIIIDPSNTAVGPESKIIIPKINVEIPVVYDEPSVEEGAVQKALERGVLHYATTSNPGELGNGVIFGHSSNNILNKGNYKFAFVLLKRLETGDTFMIQKDGKRYVYRVFAKKVVKPNDVGVLTDTGGKGSTFSLITCDPPGTSLNRLVVTAEQITPDPSANVASTAAADQKPAILPSNSPTLWSRIVSWFSG